MGKCRCPHHFVIGALIFVFGLLFLLHTTGMLSDMFVNYAWPILVMAAGLHKLIEGVCSCCGGKMMGKGMDMKGECCEGGKCASGDGEGHNHTDHK